MVKLRFGSLTDFTRIVSSMADISRRLRLPTCTVCVALKRFESRGFDLLRFLPWRLPIGVGNKIPADIKALLLSDLCLKAWAPYSLNERCAILKRTFNLSLSISCLLAFYKANDVSWKNAQCINESALKYRPEIELERTKFAKLLANIIIADRPLIYVDETTSNSEMYKKKAWSRKGTRVQVTRSNTRYNCTVYSAFSPNCLSRPVFVTKQTTTNNVDYRSFLREVKNNVKPTINCKPFLVFDGHSAHCTP